MPEDRSKYIFHHGQWLPIDYILVYTRYHSNHFRRSHRFKRQHDEYRQFFQDRLRKLGFIIAEERLTDEVSRFSSRPITDRRHHTLGKRSSQSPTSRDIR